MHIASRPPTGYDRGERGILVPNKWARHIPEVFRMRAGGSSWSDLARYLRENGVETPYGVTNWQQRSVTHLISNRAYLGEARSGEFTNPGAHPPLVDADLFAAAQQAKGERPVNGMGGALLSGIVRCAGCSYVLKPDTMKGRDGSKLRLYRCRGERAGGKCPAPASVLGRVIEPHVEATFLEGVGGLRAEAAAATDELVDAEKARDRAERELAKWLERESLADLGDIYEAGLRERVRQRDEAADALDDVRARAGLADLPDAAVLEDEWPSLGLIERRQLLASGLDAVFIRRGRDAIAERSRVLWRGEGPADLPGPGKRLALSAYIWD